MEENVFEKKLSDKLVRKAIQEKRSTGKVTTVCPKCGKVPTVAITGMYGQRVRVRCECGYLSCMELGI
ncbi:MAG: hypothetical protein IJV46_09680 [Acidaminococcaceae bacterium]|nr:hypothetical protein [Acidaminococcaceae bacterium]